MAAHKTPRLIIMARYLQLITFDRIIDLTETILCINTWE